jgi:DNA mismatch repair protein MutS
MTLDTNKGATPMMAQYIEIKGANPDSLLFYRMGDFYELFFEDAEIASRSLGIVLTKRGKHQGYDIPMCGVPVERADEYLQRLIAAGHRVAVCEQMEDPAEAKKRGPKSVVRRDVTRLVTPGTITEEKLLDPTRANLLLAISRIRENDGSWRYGIASTDISTGQFKVVEVNEASLLAEISRLDPREIVIPDRLIDETGPLKSLHRDMPGVFTPIARDGFDAASAERRLQSYFGVSSLSGFGAFTRAELSAAAAVIAYIERTQLGNRPPISPPSRDSENHIMQIDAATRANLELGRTLTGERQGSLLSVIDKTVTSAGARLLAERLAGPSTDPSVIGERHDSVAFFLDHNPLRAEIRNQLKATPDIARALSRLAMERGGPRDLAALRDAFHIAHAIAFVIKNSKGSPIEINRAIIALQSLDPDLANLFNLALSDDLPLNKRDGGFIREGYSSELDQLRQLRDESRHVIASLQARYIEVSGVRTLRIKHNNFLGYFIEVPQAAGELFLQPEYAALFIHRQTMQGAMRFSTTELADLETRIASAADKALSIEWGLYNELAGRAIAATEAIKQAADALAIIDVAAAFGELAHSMSYIRPVMTTDLDFNVEGGRHPVVEEALKRQGDVFVANDTDLSPPIDLMAGRIQVVTGPNMAGKSTYLRQNALIAVMAQTGAYVPARHAKIGIVDRLFSRVGAADDLARGRSTFMVEMIETAAILNQATERSLVILDEIGRGTATFDGLSIAWATIEHLHEKNRCRALFATHFHELTALSKRLSRLTNATMRVTDHHDEVIFLHEVVAGTANRSYGIQVAKLAGLPRTVIERATMILSELEASDRQAPVERMIDDLPLFSALSNRIPSSPAVVQSVDPVRALLESIHPDELTPRDALEWLYRLKAEAKV